MLTNGKLAQKNLRRLLLPHPVDMHLKTDERCTGTDKLSCEIETSLIWSCSESTCTVSYDVKSSCITLSGPSEDVQRAEKSFTKNCLHALHHDTLPVTQAGMIRHVSLYVTW